MSDLRIGSGAWRLYVLLFLFFAAIGLVLVLLGFDLDRVDAWLDAQGGWLDALGTLVFDFIILCIGLIGALAAASFFFPARWGPKFGPVGALVGAFVAIWMFYVLAQGGV